MFTLPSLPYSYDALQPIISTEAMLLHRNKHHAGYIEKTNYLLAKGGYQAESLEQVVSDAAKRGDQKLFNQSAQAWNHAFFWHCMAPSKRTPGKTLSTAIKNSFGGKDALRDKFVAEGTNHFASGWVWLIAKQGKLSVITTPNADDMLAHPSSGSPLLVCDLWEHAYYVDYKNEREKFLEAWFDNLANWDFATAQFEAAQSHGVGWRFAGNEEAVAII